MEQQYTGANTVVGVAGNVHLDEIVAAVQKAFGDMPRGDENLIAAPGYVGGIRSRLVRGSSQTHVVIGFPIPPMSGAHQAFVVAAALVGEGMSSPLLDRLRERSGLVYHADCWADVRDAYGQFVIEASTAPAHLHRYLTEVTRLLRLQVKETDRAGLKRARNQIAVRSLSAREAPAQRLELAALDLFALGRVRSHQEVLAAFAAVSAAQVRQAFAQMLDTGAAIGIAGKIAKYGVGRVASRVVSRLTN